ncbi:hypothetical protein CVT25_013543 [Psilocybe cyanescens]|uniref:CHAT domain-containing protein n=1 Tax=Psilocybe cyanescens TaxID=93625 RepID=A0A409XT05_PSICY|nr:hypothetical protein CVT25_013543 [Psilocybe cyanescens]
MEEASAYIDKACSLMEECISKATLKDIDNSAALLRQNIRTHALHIGAVESLACTLSLRYVYSNQTIDLQESLNLYEMILEKSDKNHAYSNNQNQEDTRELLKMVNESLSNFTTSVSLNSLDIIISYLQTSLAVIRPRKHPKHLRALTNLALSMYTRFHLSKDVSDLDNVISHLQNGLEYYTHKDPGRSKIIQLLCCALIARFAFKSDASDLKEASRQFKDESDGASTTSTENDSAQQLEVVHNLRKRIKEGDLVDLDKTKHLFRNAILRISVDCDDYPVTLVSLAAVLIAPFEKSGQHDIDQAILLNRRALELLPSVHTSRAHSVNNLAIALHMRFRLTHKQDDLSEAISLLRSVLERLDTPHSDRSGSLCSLAAALEMQFEQTAEATHLDEAIQVYREAVELLPRTDANRPTFLSHLAAAVDIRFKRWGKRDDLDESVALRKEIIDLLPPSDLNRLTHLVNLTTVLQTLFRQTGQRGDVDQVISSLKAIVDYLPPFHPMRAQALAHLADNLATRFTMTGQQCDLEEEILLHRESLQLREPSDPSQSDTFNNLACALSTRFDHTNQKSDLDEAISFHREALRLRVSPHSSRHVSLTNLASSLERRFERAGERCDLDEAISLNKAAVDICVPPHPSRATTLNSLANALGTLFEQTGHLDDLNQAIVLHREALELRPNPHPDRPSSLNNLGLVLHTRFKRTSQQGDLDDAISIHRQALELHVPSHPNRSYSLDNLAITLTDRFEQTGQRSDLDEAVMLHREALKLRASPHPNQSMTLNNLAHTLQARFTTSSKQEDLDEAILLHKEALKLRVANHPSRPMSLNNLANALMARFNQSGQMDDLNRAIALHQEALRSRTALHPDRPSSLMNLASAFGTLFEQTGQRRSLDEAILCYREALQLYPISHSLRPMCLNNLANRLIVTRIGNELPGQHDTFDEAISLVTEAVKLRSPPHPEWSLSLFHLAGLFQARCKRLAATDPNQRSFLDKTVVICKGALDLLPTKHIHRQAFVGRLATTLHARFKITGKREDIDQAILLERQNLERRGSSHPERVISLTNLASTLQDRFSRADHNQGDFEESVMLNKQAIDVYPSQHPGRFTCLANLGKIFERAYTLIGDSHYLDETFDSFALAMQCSSKRLSSSFEIATLWSDYADQYRHSSALVAYDMALQSLTQMASFSLDIYTRQNILRTASDGVARKAAQSAIAQAHLDKAVVFLEKGRAIFWSQVLHLRSPLDKLRDAAPELAHGLEAIAMELERGLYRSPLNVLDGLSKLALETEASRFRRLDEDWHDGLKEVRNLKGFEDFLQPPGIVSLKAAAAEFPIVFLVPNEQRSDCLIMTSATIHHIPLIDVSIRMLRNLADMVKFSSSQSTAPRSMFEDTSIDDTMEVLWDEPVVPETQRSKGVFGRARRSRPSSNSIFEYVLKTLWFEIVKPIINFLGLQKSDNPPVLQWCPTGIFTFLPLHAAGCYGPVTGTSTDCASDYIVSSYTPTAGLLLPRSDTNSPPSNQPFKVLAVIDSQLPFANEELAKIKTQVRSDTECLVELGVSNAPATIETICSNLQTASVVHFACHGIQDQINPLDSALFVDDGKLSISKILQPPNGSLAFLCACETGMGDAKIPDESMSLGATLLFSGYRNVVATMWKMTDEDGPTVAEAFYEELFRASPNGRTTFRPNTKKSARALHTAIQKLRTGGVDFNRWVPFIHLGQGD